jgi:hypothetical protein
LAQPFEWRGATHDGLRVADTVVGTGKPVTDGALLTVRALLTDTHTHVCARAAACLCARTTHAAARCRARGFCSVCTLQAAPLHAGLRARHALRATCSLLSFARSSLLPAERCTFSRRVTPSPRPAPRRAPQVQYDCKYRGIVAVSSREGRLLGTPRLLTHKHTFRARGALTRFPPV